MIWDVILAGSGPAASVAAHLLARAGMHVVMVDRIDPAHHKVGETLPGSAVRLLRSLALPCPSPSSMYTPIVGSASSWETAELVCSDTLRDPYGPSWRLARNRFDQDLRSAAQASGASLRTALVRKTCRDSDMWSVELDDNSVMRANWLVDATGRKSAISQSLGAKRIRHSALLALYALGAGIAGQTCFQRTAIEAAEEGWWYAAYLPGGVPIAGLHVPPRHAARLRQPSAWLAAWNRTRHLCFLFPQIETSRLLPPLDAGGSRLQPLCGERWLACGDAALSFDPLASQGLMTAIYSGKCAADHLLHGGHEAEAYSDGLMRVWNTYTTQLERYYRSCAFQWT